MGEDWRVALSLLIALPNKKKPRELRGFFVSVYILAFNALADSLVTGR
ncbi:hypothetical protein MTsDn1_04130 [Alteromonas sp. MTD1]